MKQYFCPHCGSKNVVEGDLHPNGGDLYVAEEMEACTECYDSATPYECQDCGKKFYLGDEK